MIRLLTRHLFGLPATVANMRATKRHLRNLLRFLATCLGALVLAVEVWAIIHLVFSIQQ